MYFLSRPLRSISIVVLSSVLLGLPCLAMDPPAEEIVTKQNCFSNPSFAKPASVTPMKMLPDEIVLHHIFLPLRSEEIVRLKRVCQEWKEISEKYVIWQLFGKMSKTEFFSSEIFFSKLSQEVNIIKDQKHYMRMLVFGQNSPISKTYEFNNEQIITLNFLLASSFQNIKTTSYPNFPINITIIKFMIERIKDYAGTFYGEVKPKKPLLLLFKDIYDAPQNSFPVIQYVASKCWYLNDKGLGIRRLLAECDKKKGLSKK